MGKSKRPVGDWLAAHPGIDLLVPLFAAGLWIWLGFDPKGEAARHGIYTTLATLAGLGLATATFACTLTYRTPDPLVEKYRKDHRDELRSNWTQILVSILGCAVVPLVALLLDEKATTVAFSLTVAAAALLVVRFLRIIFFLRLALFLEDHSDDVLPMEAPPMRIRRSD